MQTFAQSSKGKGENKTILSGLLGTLPSPLQPETTFPPTLHRLSWALEGNFCAWRGQISRFLASNPKRLFFNLGFLYKSFISGLGSFRARFQGLDQQPEMITSIGPDSSMNPKVCAYPFVENCFSPYLPRPNTRGRTRIKQLRICVASPLDAPKLKQFALTSNSLAGASETRR